MNEEIITSKIKNIKDTSNTTALIEKSMAVNIYKQLADFQQEVPVIHKGTEAFKYTYADLSTILKVINPLLAKHNLGFTQLLNGTDITTILFSTVSEQKIECTTLIPQNVTLASMNVFQVAGSSITYYRRYALSAMLGLVTEKDIDATGEQISNTNTAVSKPVMKKMIVPEITKVIDNDEI